MLDPSVIKNNLKTKGYHSGTVDEFIKDTAEYKKQAEKVINVVYKEVLLNGSLMYQNCISGQEGRKYSNVIPASQVAERKKIIQEQAFTVDQQWYVFGSSDIEYFETLLEPLCKSLYSDLTNFNIHHESKFTLYQTDDFTAIHKDSEAPGRKCAVLLYFSDGLEYKDGGGRLFLGTGLKKENFVEDVLPIIPNYVIIDIEKHSLFHAVEKVKNGFKRFAFLDFIWNYDQIPEARRPTRRGFSTIKSKIQPTSV